MSKLLLMRGPTVSIVQYAQTDTSTFSANDYVMFLDRGSPFAANTLRFQSSYRLHEEQHLLIAYCAFMAICCGTVLLLYDSYRIRILPIHQFYLQLINISYLWSHHHPRTYFQWPHPRHPAKQLDQTDYVDC
jgi:hypothetical protein